ncbi:hypothetical protein ASF69_18020 [Rhizobium sp. Leaf311]|uniref:hypothetical protein n=1 Tax=Rhizobium sp. Leaf311 TaxID=1736332 RepID=UPI0007148D36|nr:hypothetical protein [Rhizobium sp. Leaf311]KQQ55040.1 hypothetical protein ASF69_18020 [Rhizobium sp. Leaf311]
MPPSFRTVFQLEIILIFFSLKFHAIAAALVGLQGAISDARAAEIRFADSEQAIRDDVFNGGQSGVTLWPKTDKFCSPIRSAMKITTGGETYLLFSNRQQTEFHTAICRNNCSLSDENEAFNDCWKSLNGQICILYAAIRSGTVYDLAVSGDGKTMSQTCD